jgi:hypothetical protein
MGFYHKGNAKSTIVYSVVFEWRGDDSAIGQGRLMQTGGDERHLAKEVLSAE